MAAIEANSQNIRVGRPVTEHSYLSHQKAFWNVETLDEARFDRVDTRTNRTDGSWEAMADADIRRVLDGMPIPPGATVLELGCGVGRLLARAGRVLPSSVQLVGVDISEGMIRFSAEATAHLPNVALHVTDGAHLPMLADSSVHFAYSLHVFIHIADGDVVRSYLRDLHRVLVSGGRFRFNIRHLDVWRDFGWSPGGIVARLMVLTGLRRTGDDRWKDGDQAEFCGLRWRQADLRRALEQTGFKVEHLAPGPESGELWCQVVKQ